MSLLNKHEQKIETRVRAASAGPWSWEIRDEWRGNNILRTYRLCEARDYTRYRIKRSVLKSSFWLDKEKVKEGKSKDYLPTIEDAEFIAHARLDVQYLLNTIEQLRKQIDENS